MSIIFFIYTMAFIALLFSKKKWGYACFSVASVASILMFFYHTDGHLPLNF